jgi:hypothetical protein
MLLLDVLEVFVFPLSFHIGRVGGKKTLERRSGRYQYIIKINIKHTCSKDVRMMMTCKCNSIGCVYTKGVLK